MNFRRVRKILWINNFNRWRSRKYLAMFITIAVMITFYISIIKQKNKISIEDIWNESIDAKNPIVPCPLGFPDPPIMREPVNPDFKGQGSLLPLCPTTPEKLQLKGPIAVNHMVPRWHDLELANSDLEAGGSWQPTDCIARHNVAIVVPYRDREKQLLLFLQHIHPFLKKQKIAYTIYLLEQAPGKVFNRGLDRNIGFVESQKLNPSHECTMFHDVDLLPLDERNLYTCPDQPRHVCVEVDYINNFMPLYKNKFAEFGHVTFFRNDHFWLINGYSNLYLGWGAEDDDIHARVKSKGLHVYRYPDDIARYYGIPHVDESLLPRPHSLAQNVSRFRLLNLAERRMDRDGLNNLKYSVTNITREKLFTRITFDVNEDAYALQAIEEEKVYKMMYGSLTEYWKKLDFIPPPYWWLNQTLAEEVYKQKPMQWMSRTKQNPKHAMNKTTQNLPHNKLLKSALLGFYILSVFKRCTGNQ